MNLKYDTLRSRDSDNRQMLCETDASSFDLRSLMHKECLGTVLLSSAKTQSVYDIKAHS